MSKKKSFNEGLASGIKIAEDIMKKEAKAMDYLANKIDSVESKQDDIRKAVNNILEYQNSKAVEEYYGICNKLSPNSELQDEEKHVLLDVLATLAYNSENFNDNKAQKSYFLNLKHYIQLTDYNPNTAYNYEFIENIRDLDSQEIILKCIREFLFLENFDFSFVEDYKDVFEYFSIKDKKICQMDRMIDITYYLFGEDGIIEMYGDHVMARQHIFDDEDNSDENGEVEITLEKLIITDVINISENEEKLFENKAIYFRGNVECKGRLIFRNCQLFYYEKGVISQIHMASSSYIELDTCVIRGLGVNNQEYFISGSGYSSKIVKCIFEEAAYFMENTRYEMMQIEECEILNCWSLIKADTYNVKSSINKCFILCEKEPSYIDEEFLNNCSVRVNLFKISNCIIFGCRMVGNNDFVYDFNDDKIVGVVQLYEHLKNNMKNRKVSGVLFSHAAEITNCTFENINMHISAIKIVGCKFKNCRNIIDNFLDVGSGVKTEVVKDCLFHKCKKILNSEYYSVIIQDCQFSECIGYLIRVGDNSRIESCQFYNIKISEDYNTAISINGTENYASSSVVKCEFNGLKANDGYLIKVDATKKIKPIIASLEHCTLKNACTLRKSGAVIKSSYYYYGLFDKKHIEQGISTYDLNGFSNIPNEGGECLDYTLKETDVYGNKIGADENVKPGISGKTTNAIYHEELVF
ncbi:MAG: hypothetical protein J1D87_01645 [Lachnospiraceae bacterium]|nr:hypothetical protein [Lachnospiraceae bacterium]